MSPTAGRWSGSLDDLAHVIAARVAGEHGVLVQALLRKYRGRLSAPGAYGAILRTYNFLLSRDVRELPPAVAALQQVVDQEPENALGWALLARLYQANHSFELTDLDTPIDQAIAFAYQACASIPRARGYARCWPPPCWPKVSCRRGGKRWTRPCARTPTPSYTGSSSAGCWRCSGIGSAESPSCSEARARNPYHLPQVYHGLWADHLRRGELEEAYRAALDTLTPLSSGARDAGVLPWDSWAGRARRARRRPSSCARSPRSRSAAGA